MKTNPLLASISDEDLYREIIYRLCYNVGIRSDATLQELKATVKNLL